MTYPVSHYLLNIIVTLFQHKFQTGFLIITNTKIYIDDIKRIIIMCVARYKTGI